MKRFANLQSFYMKKNVALVSLFIGLTLLFCNNSFAQHTESIVGNKGKNKPLTVDYETNVDSSFIHEVGTVMNIKSPAIITKANFVINSNNYPDSLQFTINVYNLKNGKPDSSLLPEPVTATTAMKRGTLSVDLKKYNVIVDDDFFLSLEWKEGHPRDKVGFGGGMSGNISYHRIKGKSEWEKVPMMKLGFYANVEYVKKETSIR